jgi:hypothetical protein
MPRWSLSWVEPSLPFVPGETLGPLCWTGQRRRFGVVPFLKALRWLRGLCGFQRWWPRQDGEAELCGVSYGSSVRLWGAMFFFSKWVSPASGALCMPSFAPYSRLLPSSSSPCHLLASRRLSRRMSSGTLVRASSAPAMLVCAALVVTRSRSFVPAF